MTPEEEREVDRLIASAAVHPNEDEMFRPDPDLLAETFLRELGLRDVFVKAVDEFSLRHGRAPSVEQRRAIATTATVHADDLFEQALVRVREKWAQA
jgi:hypothetical protein